MGLGAKRVRTVISKTIQGMKKRKVDLRSRESKRLFQRGLFAERKATIANRSNDSAILGSHSIFEQVGIIFDPIQQPATFCLRVNMADPNAPFPYVHGFSSDEQQRLIRQALFMEHVIYQDIDLREVKRLLEVGCGVSAQSAILLRRFPKLHLTGIDLSNVQLAAAAEYLASSPYATRRYEHLKMNGANMEFETNSFDGAFLCWVLEHVPDPSRVLNEVRRVVSPGSPVYVTEVFNSSFFLDPYSPNVWKYWMAFNDYQYDQKGDPFIGVKLGNLLSGLGFREVNTNVKIWHLDNRCPGRRKEAIEDWESLILSSADQLIEARYVSEEIVDRARKEFDTVKSDPNAVFFNAIMQASAKVY